MPISERLALELAVELGTIPDAPKTDEGQQAVARHLISLCENEEDARWVVDEAVFQWQNWKGPRRLAAMLYDRKHPELLPANSVKPMPPREDVRCEACGDWGHLDDPVTKLRVWCQCDMGKWQQSRHPGLVEALNRNNHMKSLLSRSKGTRKRISQEDIDQAFRHRQNGVETVIREARQALEDESASAERKEIAHETLKSLGAETEVSA